MKHFSLAHSSQVFNSGSCLGPFFDFLIKTISLFTQNDLLGNLLELAVHSNIYEKSVVRYQSPHYRKIIFLKNLILNDDLIKS